MKRFDVWLRVYELALAVSCSEAARLSNITCLSSKTDRNYRNEHISVAGVNIEVFTMKCQSYLMRLC